MEIDLKNKCKNNIFEDKKISLLNKNRCVYIKYR